MPTFAEIKAKRTLDAARKYIDDRVLLEWLMKDVPDVRQYVEGCVAEWSGETDEVLQVAA